MVVRLILKLLGPVFAKEMVEMARRFRYYLSRALYGVALLFVLVLVWEDNRWQLQYNPIGGMARMAEELFQAASIVQYGAVYLFVPLFLCAVIAGEREERTLDLLFTTQLTNRQIVLGKFGSRVAALVCLILCGLPVMSFIMMFGGIDPDALVRVLAATLLAVLVTGAHAVYFSTITRSPLGALVRTYWWLALWLIGVPIAVMVPVDELTRGPGDPLFLIALSILLFTNPIGPFVVALNGFLYGTMASSLGSWFFPLTFVAPMAWSFVLIWRAIRRLRQDPIPFVHRLGRLRAFRSFREGRQLGSAERVPGSPTRAERTWLGRTVRNPLWLRARLAHVFDREGYIGRIQLAGWAVALGIFALVAVTNPRDIDDEDCSMAFLAPTWIAVAALATLLAATSLVGDRRRGFLDLVLVTPMTGQAIIDGTMLAVWEHLKRIYWLPWVLGVIFWLTGASLGFGIALSLITATLFLALLVLYGVACSLVARSIPGALVGAFAFPLAVNLGTGLMIAIFEEHHGPVLWLLCPLLLGASWAWVHRQPTVASVSTFLISVHLVIAALATCWTCERRAEEYPIAAMHPGFLILTTLEDHSAHLFADLHRWRTIIPCYWAALVVNFCWARWWLIRNFDRFVERVDPSLAWRTFSPVLASRLPATASCNGEASREVALSDGHGERDEPAQERTGSSPTPPV